MNQKFNPWISLAALLLLAVILVLACTGCTQKADAETQERFTVESVGVNMRIITDTKTGEQYLYYTCGYGGGLCKLED